MNPNTIFLATDHAGFQHRNAIREWLLDVGYDVEDCGAREYDDQDDFPDYISTAAKAVSSEPHTTCAIIFGGSGQGEAMLANRYRNVRAAVYYGGNKEIVKLSREHNNANVLSIGARFVAIDETKEVVWDWLHTNFLPQHKYARRIEKMKRFTEQLCEILTRRI